MKRKQLNAISLGLAWLASLGMVFVLGILSAFAFHLGPGAASTNSDLSMDQRQLMLTIEQYTGRPADIASIMAVGSNDGLPDQLEQTLLAILRLPDYDERDRSCVNLARGLPARNLMAAIRFVRELKVDPARNQMLARFIEAWAGEDGRRAMAFATSLANPAEKEWAIQAGLRGWSRVEPSAAWGWVLEQTGTTRRSERWLAIILSNLGSVDRVTAFSLLEQMPQSSFTDQMAAVVMQQMLLVDSPREAIDWLGEFPPSSQLAAATVLAKSWAATEPRAAVAWLSKSFPGETDALASVLSEWVYLYPEDAADWVWANSSGFARRELLDTLAEEWIANDGLAPLANWLNNHGPDMSLDGAISRLAMRTADFDPVTALNWVQFIVDDDSRSMMEIVVGRQWMRDDPQAAAVGLPSLIESDSARAALLEPLGSEPEELLQDSSLIDTEIPLEEIATPIQ